MTAVDFSRRGLITMSAPPADFNLAAIVETVREAIRVANEALVERRRVIDSWHEAYGHLADPYKQALDDVQLDGQPLVLRVEVVPAGELLLDVMRVPEPVVLIHLSPSVLASAGLGETTLWRELPQLTADHTIRVRQETTPAQIAQALERGLKRAIEETNLEEDRLWSRSDEEATLTAELLRALNRETNNTIEETNPTIKPKIV